MKISCPNESGTLRHVLLKRPQEAFLSQKEISKQWESLNYSSPPDLEESTREYEEFVRILEESKIRVDFLPEDRRTGLDSLYVRDAAVVTSRGIVLGRMEKSARSGEVEALEAYLRYRRIPVLGRISGEGRLEGGDVVRLDMDTLAVGSGYRTNREGISQLAEITQGFCREIIEVPLPHWDGPEDVLHLMSFISPLAPGTALIYSRMMPVFFRQILIERGIELIEIAGPEFAMMACNVLALAPHKCLMLDGCPQTKALLERNGLEVLTYSGEEISRKGAGGPTCLTLPLVRE